MFASLFEKLLKSDRLTDRLKRTVSPITLRKKVSLICLDHPKKIKNPQTNLKMVVWGFSS
jgi:hypothetical protein